MAARGLMATRAGFRARCPPRPRRSFLVSRIATKGSASGGAPALMARPRSSSALNSAPSRMAILVIHSQIRKMIMPAMLPYTLL
jgi:hypothetical protein